MRTLPAGRSPVTGMPDLDPWPDTRETLRGARPGPPHSHPDTVFQPVSMPTLPSTSGFTLIEVLVVVVIMGLLASFAVPRYSETRVSAFRAVLVSDLRNLSTSQEARWRMQEGIRGTLNDLDVHPSPGVTLDPHGGGPMTGWAARAATGSLPGETCGVFYGADAVNAASGIVSRRDPLYLLTRSRCSSPPEPGPDRAPEPHLGRSFSPGPFPGSPPPPPSGGSSWSPPPSSSWPPSWWRWRRRASSSPWPRAPGGPHHPHRHRPGGAGHPLPLPPFPHEPLGPPAGGADRGPRGADRRRGAGAPDPPEDWRSWTGSWRR
jgi:prepilin-type N-terminal cleavage/methylation domain-containing protein